ncbi:identified by similarity to GB:AAK22812.1; match to protein family HMM PF06676 [Olavius sp. associated proteobacterium Delta 1]|nr:identified by similarity to GB:AAK22812.1; match to protein family HMM PF06676 [Olavius sp. associated proteobacterium Delta 1]
MIAYDLQCTNGHTFEGWFEDRKAYLGQQKKSLIACPVCNETSVDIVPSTFAIKSSQTSSPQQLSAEEAALQKISKEAVEFVEKNFDNVGCDFAKEALKIHYGASEPRNIRGVSTKDEEKTLKDEGVQFFKIPMPAPPDTDS